MCWKTGFSGQACTELRDGELETSAAGRGTRGHVDESDGVTACFSVRVFEPWYVVRRSISSAWTLELPGRLVTLIGCRRGPGVTRPAASLFVIVDVVRQESVMMGSVGVRCRAS